MRSANLSRSERIQRTRLEKHIYLPLQFRSRDDNNEIYECESEARQHLLYHITPFVNDIVCLYLCQPLFDRLNNQYPRWIENIFTRKSANSNDIMFDVFTSSELWPQNDWSNEYFRRFCRLMRAELALLFKVLGIPYIDVHRMRNCIRKVIEENGLLLITDSELGRIPHLWVIALWFGRTLDNNSFSAKDYWSD